MNISERKEVILKEKVYGVERKEKENKYAYVSLVMKGDSYTPGALAMAQSLKETKTSNDIVCMVTPDVSQQARDAMLKVYDKVIEVDYITLQTKSMKSAKQEAMYGDWKDASFTKWQCLSLTNYEKVLFVDADIVFTDNVDHLFELNAPAGIFSLPWAEPYVKGKGIVNHYGELKHGETVSNRAIEKSKKDSFLAHGGLVLLTTGGCAEQSFKNLVKEYTNKLFGLDGNVSSMDEQMLILIYERCNIEWTSIYQTFNWFVGKWNWLKKEEIPVTYHYYNVKPWEQSRDAWDDLKIWWDFADKYISNNREYKKFFKL